MEDYSNETRVHSSRAVRVLLVIAGFGFVGLGILGAVLPLLPSTPFVLLAAACFARASARFYNALLNNRLLGPAIRDWRRHRSIPYRTKWMAIGLMLVTLGASILFAVKDPRGQVGLAALAVVLAIGISRIPSLDRPGRNRSENSPGLKPKF